MLATILLVKVADWKIRFLLPGFNQFLGSIAGAIIDNHPLELAKSLDLQAVVDSRQLMLAVESLSGNGERRPVHDRLISGLVLWIPDGDIHQVMSKPGSAVNSSLV